MLKNTFYSMEKLFEALGIKNDTRPEYPTNQLLYLLESVINRGAVLSNVKAINKNLRIAAQKSAELGAHTYALERELQQLEAENQKLQKENAALQTSATETEQKTISLQQAECRIAELEKAHENKLVEQLMIFIAFRDNLVMREGLAKDQRSDEYMRLFSGLLAETANDLRKCGITILDQTGRFDESCQTIKQAVPTQNEALHEQIVEVFRPGYKLGDVMLRPEEVIVYSCNAS